MSIKDLKIGESVYVQSYKHSGSLHRTWSKAQVIDIKDDFVVVVTDHSWVVEADGRRWLTKEPAICFYYTKRWYNIISMVRKTGIYYYCNLASPSLYDGEAIKNIDYDLDVKVFPDGEYMILDENEYEYHASVMNYPENIKKIISSQMEELLDLIVNKKEPFDFSYINDYIMKYFGLNS
ncbi:MAG: DUF402 domain-containing protein [Solobacterium sp.]|nr:DUF402 domain-containing protein [Solobacterium sp.]MDY5653647.1 DUF402 domain-containing protein [Erysipelotrichaceae bacterium]